jgi:hypothetical protein
LQFWCLNSGPCSCQVGALPLEPWPQNVLCLLIFKICIPHFCLVYHWLWFSYLQLPSVGIMGMHYHMQAIAYCIPGLSLTHVPPYLCLLISCDCKCVLLYQAINLLKFYLLCLWIILLVYFILLLLNVDIWVGESNTNVNAIYRVVKF